MTSCERARRDLLSAVENELDGTARDAVLEHVQACAACAAEMATLDRSRAALQSLPPIAIPGELARLPALPMPRTVPMLPVRHIAVAAALVLSTALVVGLLLQSRGPSEKLVVIEDAALTAPDVWESIEDFSGLDGEWLASLK